MSRVLWSDRPRERSPSLSRPFQYSGLPVAGHQLLQRGALGGFVADLIGAARLQFQRRVVAAQRSWCSFTQPAKSPAL